MTRLFLLSFVLFSTTILFAQCGFSDIQVSQIECNEDGTYNFDLSFIPTNTGDEGFDLFDDQGDFIAFFRYDSVPYRITEFTPRDAEYDFIRICDNDREDCCTEYEWMSPDCEEMPSCELQVEIAEVDCIDGESIFVIEYNCEDSGGELVIFFEDEIVITHNCDSTTAPRFTISLSSDAEEIRLILVYQDDDCETVLEFLNPCYESDECHISPLEIFDIECSEEGESYFLSFDFDHDQSDESRFIVLDHLGEVIGEYNYGDLPVRLAEFEPRGSDYDFLRVCDLEQEDCCAEVEWMTPECSTCPTWSVNHSQCMGSEVSIILSSQSEESDQYVISVDEQEYGTFELGASPLVFSDIPAEGQEIMVSIASENCSDSILLELPICVSSTIDPYEEYPSINVSQSYIRFSSSHRHARVYDLGGAAVHCGESDDGEISQIDIASLIPGLYILIIDGVFSFKFFKS